MKKIIEKYFNSDEQQEVFKMKEEQPELFSTLIKRIINLDIAIQSGNKKACQNFIKVEKDNISQFRKELKK